MDDEQIIDLYWARSETAISATADKYGRYCSYIASNILCSEEDSEECVNDTYMRAWNCMPPHRPAVLKAFLGKITRNLSLNRLAQRSSQKRGLGQAALVLEEIQECVGRDSDTEQLVEDMVLVEVLNRFLASLSADQRRIFMKRYWYFSSIKEIADCLGVGESKVKMSLLRSKDKLRKMLEKEGVL